MKEYRKSVLTFFGLLLVSVWMVAPIAAQQPVVTAEYSYRRYTTQDGLPTTFIDKLLIDSKGFLWIGSVAGVSRFDGQKFDTYLQGGYNKINYLNEAIPGYVDFLSTTKFFTLNTITNQISTTQFIDSLQLTFTRDMVTTPSNYRIFETADRKQKWFCELKGATIEKLFTNKIFNNFDGTEGLLFDEKNRELYAPVAESGVYIVKNNQTAKLIKIKRPYTIFEYNNEICAITSFGIYALRNNQFEQIISCSVYNQEGQIKVVTDANNDLIFYSSNAVYRLSSNQLEKVFKGNIINDLVLDNEGNIWIASNEGLYCLFKLQFKNFTIKNDIVRCVVKKNDGKILIGSSKGELKEINPTDSYNASTRIYTPSRYNAAFFYSYGCTVNDKTYLPGPGDILVLQRNESKWLHLPFYDPYKFVNALSDSLLIAGGPHLTVLFDLNGNLLKKYDDNYLGQQINANSYADSEKRIWLGGDKGITILRNEVLYKKMFEEQLSKITIMGKDEQNRIWIGSENRLFRSNGDTVEFIRKFDNLLTNIHFTRSGLAIFCTIGGIYIFNNDLTHYTFYNHDNGFTGQEPFEANLTEDHFGNVYLPTLEALVSFNPQQLLTKQSPPKLYIQSLSVSSDNIHWQKTDTLHLRLSHTQKNVRFSYIGLSYSQAQNVRYQYRLLGFQNQWSNPVSERQVTFNNLPPAKYTFQLKASAGTEETQTDTISSDFLTSRKSFVE